MVLWKTIQYIILHHKNHFYVMTFDIYLICSQILFTSFTIINIALKPVTKITLLIFSNWRNILRILKQFTIINFVEGVTDDNLNFYLFITIYSALHNCQKIICYRIISKKSFEKIFFIYFVRLYFFSLSL